MNKMMILAAGLALTATTAQAQIRFGVEAGVNLANMHLKFDGEEIGNPKVKIGPKAGFIADIGLTSQLSFQPGIFYSMKGAVNEMDETTTITIGGTQVSQRSMLETKFKTTYIEVPLNFQYEMSGPHFFIGAGPYVAMAVDGHTLSSGSVTTAGVKVDVPETKEEIKWGNDGKTTDFRRLDYGVNINLGYMLDMGLFIRAQYGLGLANFAADNDNFNAKNTAFAFTLGYMLGGKRN